MNKQQSIMMGNGYKEEDGTARQLEVDEDNDDQGVRMTRRTDVASTTRRTARYRDKDEGNDRNSNNAWGTNIQNCKNINHDGEWECGCG